MLTMTPIEPPSRVPETGPSDPRRIPVTPTPEIPVTAADRQTFDGLPAEPPADVLAEVDAAMERLEALRDRRLTLRFEVSEGQRVRIEVVDDEGNVVRRVPAIEAIEIITGSADAAGPTTTTTDEPSGFDGMG